MTKMEEYEEYIEKYARDRGISKEEAETHEIVREYWRYLRGKSNDVVAGASDS